MVRPLEAEDQEQAARVSIAVQETARVIQESAETQRTLADRLDEIAARMSQYEPPFADLERGNR